MPAARRRSNAAQPRLRACAHADREQVVAVQRRPRRRGRQLDPVLAGEQLAVAGGDLVATRHPAVEPPQLAQPERALDVGDAVVEAERPASRSTRPVGRRRAHALARDAVRAEAAQPAAQLVVLGGDDAALAGRDRLDRVERERRHVGAAGPPTFAPPRCPPSAWQPSSITIRRRRSGASGARSTGSPA